MEEKIGIENMKKAAVAVIRFGEKVQDAAEDGKVTWAEGVALAVGTLPDVYNIVKSAKQLKEEYKDLDDVERKELITFVVETLDLTNEETEVKIEKGFIALVAFEDFLSEFRKN